MKMGIFCEINLIKPINAVFAPGDTVAGIIMYKLNETMDFDKITTSLKGNGLVEIKSSHSKPRADDRFSSLEIYVDKDHIVRGNRCKIVAGCYESEFQFKLPDTLPSSYYYKGSFREYRIKCRVKYYIRIKFERPGWFNFAKHFKKEIYVVSGIVPKLLREPVIYGQSSKLLRLFSKKEALVNIKATIENSVIPMGGSIKIDCEITNDTNIVITKIDVKLMEVYNFKMQGYRKLKVSDEIPNSGIEIGGIDPGGFSPMTIEMNVPRNKVTLQHAKIMQRDYFVRITAVLPLPHRNVVLDIPVEIGSIKSNLPKANEQIQLLPHHLIHPADWEVMSKPSHYDIWI